MNTTTSDKDFILVVDDDKGMAGILEDLLQDEGYDVLTAYNGKEAVAIAGKNPVVFSIIDVNLPDIGGNELFKKLQETRQSIEAIIITGNATLERVMDAVGVSGILAYETKPLDWERLLSFTREVMDRKKAERKLQSTEGLHSTLLQNIADMVFSLDPDGNVNFVNRAVEEYFGMTLEELRGIHISFFWCGDSIPAIDNSIRSLRKKPRTQRLECICDVRSFELSINPVLINGDLTGIICISREITEKKMAEEELRRERDFTTSIINTSPAFFVVTDRDGIIKLINRSMLSATGHPADEVAGKEFKAIFLLPEERSISPRGDGSSAANRDSPICGSHILTADGHKILVDWYTSPITGSSGDITSYIGVGIDVTEKTKLQQQLAQMQKMDAIGLLAGGVAHDLNNMLGIILGNAQMALLDTEEMTEPHESLEAIVDASNRASGLIKKLLTFARKDSIKLKDTSVKDILESMTKMLKGSIRKTIDIQQFIQDDCIISCDENQIHQALLNICLNAADAMPNGGSLTIECGEISAHETQFSTFNTVPASGRYCLIQVSDTGFGIPESILQKVIDPFFTTKDIGKGTGLGLSVTHGIIKEHKGFLHIYSELNHGTCVKIYIPISTSSPGIEVAEIEDAIHSGAETILVVDDEVAMRNMTAKLLTRRGYAPIIAENGKHAIDILRDNSDGIDLVVLDLMMPEMDGADVFSRLKEIKPEIKVIFASGYSVNGQAKALLNNNQNRFLQKPFDIDRLCVMIREMLDDKVTVSSTASTDG